MKLKTPPYFGAPVARVAVLVGAVVVVDVTGVVPVVVVGATVPFTDVGAVVVVAAGVQDASTRTSTIRQLKDNQTSFFMFRSYPPPIFLSLL